LFKIINIIILNKNDVDARAWTRKYFIEASEENIFLGLEIKGTNLIRLISNPIHVPNHDEEEIEIRDPDIRVIMKIIL